MKTNPPCLWPCRILAVVLSATSSVAFAQSTVPANETVIELSPFEVSTAQDTGYRSKFSTSGTLVREELKNLPSSVSVMNEDFLKDIGAADIFEASRYAVGGEFGDVENNDTRFSFRGINTNWQTRNFFIWYLPTDNFSIERIEVVRGPNALLYGDAEPGGLLNLITKRAAFNKDFTTIDLTLGSYGRREAAIDLNRRMGSKFAFRINAKTRKSEDFRQFRHDDFDGLHGAATWQVFKDTRIRVEAERGIVNRNQGNGAYEDRFSNYSEATGGTTGTEVIPAGNSWISVDGVNLLRLSGATGNRRSNGLQSLLLDERFIRASTQSVGDVQFQNRRYTQAAGYVEQTFFKKLNFELAYNLQDQDNLNRRSNAGAADLYRDPNPTLPNGTANPNYNKLYVDKTNTYGAINNKVDDYRISGTYEHDFGRIFGSHRVVAFLSKRSDHFKATSSQERPTAALGSNLARRSYLESDGNFSNTDFNLLANDGSRFFGTGFWALTRNELTASSTALISSFWDGRLRTLAGYRRDNWVVRRQATVTQAVPSAPGATSTVNEIVGFNSVQTFDPKISDDSKNYGGVFHAVRGWHGLDLSFVGNYSESFRPVANNIDVFGRGLDPIKGKGSEYGFRIEAFDNKVALNTVFYTIEQVNSPAAVAAGVRNEINSMFFTDAGGALLPGALVGPAINTNGDTVTLTSKGFEVELAYNPTKNWTFSANYSNNDKKQEDVYPLIVPFYERAIAENRPLTQYTGLNNLVGPALANADLVAPEVKESFNFFTRYQFADGWLKGFRLGIGANLRSRTYLGNIATGPVYNGSLVLINGLIGYSLPVRGGKLQLTLNVNNLTDEFAFRAGSAGSGDWIRPREYRFNASYRF